MTRVELMAEAAAQSHAARNGRSLVWVRRKLRDVAISDIRAAIERLLEIERAKPDMESNLLIAAYLQSLLSEAP